jgi:Tfp pilus assembly protein PilW
MRRSSERGFSLVELMVASATLLVLLGAVLTFFSRSQVVYTNERATLDMVQDMRTVFDRFTNEIRMAGAGLPAPRGVILGSTTTLVVRGDFKDIATIVTSTGSITIGSTATFPVGSTNGFAANQTVSLLNNEKGWAVLAKITAVDAGNNTITVDANDLLALTAGTTITDFSAGTIINVIERRTYSIIRDSDNNWAITRTITYEDTQTAGAVVQDTEIIGRNVEDESGNAGLTFTYYQADGTSALNADGSLNPDVTKKVQIQLKARSANPDLESGKYRTFTYTALVQVRGQYAPGVGF